MLEVFHEIGSAIRQNKLRSFLTCFSVAWGIFMLIILLGAGKGIEQGIKTSFLDAMSNSLWIFGQKTTLDYGGMKKGRDIILQNEDLGAIQARTPSVGLSSTRYTIPVPITVAYHGEYASYEVRTAMPDYQSIENIKIVDGRFLNQRDAEELRKTAIISTDVREFFFKGRNPIGERILINNIPFLVAGIFEDKDNWDNNRCIYIPIQTAQIMFSAGHDVSIISVTLDGVDMEKSMAVADDIKRSIAQRHHFDPNDPSGIHVNNVFEHMQRSLQVTKGMAWFVWFIGIGTIIAGVVGISNIMTISVKDRTQEIGVRKALGAKPLNIILMVLLESILLTLLAGYVGMVIGVGVLELVSSAIPPSKFFANPSADINTAMTATVILVVAGAIAGYFPARHAAHIRPIEALRYE